MVKLKTQEYIVKYSAEFPDGRINRELPQRYNICSFRSQKLALSQENKIIELAN